MFIYLGFFIAICAFTFSVLYPKTDKEKTFHCCRDEAPCIRKPCKCEHCERDRFMCQISGEHAFCHDFADCILKINRANK